MFRIAAALLAMLAATPAVAVSVSVASCNGHSAELVGDGSGWTLKVDGTDVALTPSTEWEGPICVSRNGETLFGLIQLSGEEDESYFLIDPATRELAPISYEEAEALEFWEDEGDWHLGD